MINTLKKLLPWLILLILISAGYYFYQKSHEKKPEELYKFEEITQGDVEKNVSANGTINPVVVVTVGTQVSGTVSKLYVDFNDKVTKGQLLLELDDRLFNAQIEQTQGNVRNAQALVELAQANEARSRSLFAQEYVSKQELDTTVQALKSAKAQLATSQAQLRRDSTNLSFSKIRSPVSGVIIDRPVDIGQTVAASLQTPTLVQIAQDLSKMQISTSYAEADIGNIKVGQIAKFTVDAYPNRDFQGVVKQLRLNPTTTSNVVTYNVVVSVDNPDEILLPGMTAYVNIVVAKQTNVLLVPNAALRYKPSNLELANADKKETKGQRSSKKSDKKDSGQSSKGKIYVLRTDNMNEKSLATPHLVKVSTGLTDGKMTEIISNEIKLGDQVIVSENLADGKPAGGGSANRMPRMF